MNWIGLIAGCVAFAFACLVSEEVIGEISNDISALSVTILLSASLICFALGGRK